MSNVNVLILNRKIIYQEAAKKGFNYTGDNLHTYSDWKYKGFVPKRRQRAFIKPHLWTRGENRRRIIVGLFRLDQVIRFN